MVRIEDIAAVSEACLKYLNDTDPTLTSATNIPDEVFLSCEDLESYRKLKDDHESKSQEQHHAEAVERWNK